MPQSRTNPPVPLPSPDALLAMPAAQAARLLCRRCALAAESAVDAIGGSGRDGIAARHDLRVALRQLRVTLRAYRAVLGDTVPDGFARRARMLASRIGPLRERDVQQALLHSVALERTARQRTALATLDLGADDSSEKRHDAGRVRQRWAQLSHALSRALETWTERHRLDGPRHATPFAYAAADALDAALDRIARRCSAISDAEDRAALHATRLAMKSARYLLKPLAVDGDDSATLLDALEEAQDLLGTINDAHLLRDRLRATRTALMGVSPKPTRAMLGALDASERDLSHRIAAAFARCAPWTDATSRADIIARGRAVAAAWRTAATPPMEIERKWLLSALPPRVRELTPSALRQGYLPGERLVERVRSVIDAGGERWYRTVKFGRGLSRIEIEEATSADLGAALFALTDGMRVEKRRYTVTDGDFAWEIDDFTDRSLVLAEVELPSEETVVEPPVWLAPYIVREVTGEKGFTNWKLAR